MEMRKNEFVVCFGVVLCVFALASDARVAPRLVLGGHRDMIFYKNFTNLHKPAYNSEAQFPSDEPNICSNCVCGVGRQTRIVNGDVTNTYEFPWAVAITYQGAHHCGASLITRRHLLTAAHCVSGFQKSYFTVRVADNVRYRVKSLTIHPDYDRNSFNNDIAVIELENPVALNGLVKTVCLPDDAKFGYTGETGVAIGWGRIGEGEPLSDELRKVDVPIMSVEECKQSNYPDTRVTDNMFCAGYLSGSRDSCNGDSGGALHVRKPNGAMEVVGLVSFGRGCARPNFPGVYTKVTNYLDWIGDRLNGECVCPPPNSLF